MSVNLKKNVNDLTELLIAKAKISLFHPETVFTFSPEYKHANVTIISPTVVKAN